MNFLSLNLAFSFQITGHESLASNSTVMQKPQKESTIQFYKPFHRCIAIQ